MRRFAAKTVLITGAGRGIGRATALRLAEEGAAVAVVDLDEEPAHEVAKAIGKMGRTAVALTADVAADDAPARLLVAAEKALGPLDVLVNNAAKAGPAGLADTDDADWDAEFAVTLRAAYRMAQAVLPGMCERGRGAIVNVASVNALMTFGNPAYSAAKAGLLSLTRQIATEYGPAGIRCNAVSPGTVQTNNPSWQSRIARDPQIFEKLNRWYPVGRVGKPEDIAAAIAYLAADEAAFVNGTNLVVDGGLTAGMAQMVADISPGGR
ncbi:MAG: SDR family oxidoreductase [Deltaproteobacteria bacterium]|jgi:NAD(P)-dependent dehydrogenase (short-subunit alcohol dehydrogenase family)|nr:SDR family oxidoreductase [Deltaproteobacteria bacterium]